MTVFERDEGRRRPVALRGPRRQAREVDHRSAAWRSSSRRGSSSSTTSTSARDVTGGRAPRALRRVVIAIGSRVSRDLDVPGRELAGIHPAMDYLYQRNRWVAASQGRPVRAAPEPGTEISAPGKKVIVIGGGDTGMDCISNSHRERGAQRGDARRLRASCPTARTLAIRGRCRRSGPRRPTRSTRAGSAAGAPRSPASAARTETSATSTRAR